MERTAKDASEATLAALLERGDFAAAATATLRAYGPAILGFLVAVLRHPDDGAEVYSSFSEDLWKGISGFRRESSVKTWAYKLAWNAAMRFRSSPHRKRLCHLGTSQASKVPAETSFGSSARVHQQREVALERLRQQLDVEEQTLLILRVDRKLSWNEVADVMSLDGERLDAAALRKRFERIKLRLAALIRNGDALDRSRGGRASTGKP